MYNGYIATAKVNATIAQHQNAISFVSGTFTRCAMGAATQKVQSYSGEVGRKCSDTAGQWMSHFFSHFDVSGWENPYTGGAGGGKPVEMNKGGGSSCNRSWGKGIVVMTTFKTCSLAGEGLRIRTNIGDENGADKYVSVDIRKD